MDRSKLSEVGAQGTQSGKLLAGVSGQRQNFGSLTHGCAADRFGIVGASICYFVAGAARLAAAMVAALAGVAVPFVAPPALVCRCPLWMGCATDIAVAANRAADFY